MTIAELVKLHGLPVEVWVPDKPSYPAFVVHTVADGGWLVSYGPDNPNHPVRDCPWLSDYEIVRKKVSGLI